ncbi:hypothetical protein RM780_03900 [Streptomyces sp. DSM 44917]|uniref:DUF6919 domain-containing protein n=1 Tax=Streptomyces boetiae TaxID=3075541 RepID=A0ABU2L3G5_9ACTN|nr:hypothetical protein [Streptomyces sp. DSM 44917]MDT0306106.1 hypothetical protein [Streptomyces sp. DSM 44917]
MFARLDRRWRDARTLEDLAGLTALWLEGGLRRHPNGYNQPDEETRDLIPALAAANRAGYLTDNSQPGCDEPGYDGARWQQRAAIEGWVADRALLHRLERAARNAGLLVSTDGGPIAVTRRDGRPYTAFGARMSRRQISHAWRGLHPAAVGALADATHLTIVDPEWGPHTRLWDALNAATR